MEDGELETDFCKKKRKKSNSTTNAKDIYGPNARARFLFLEEHRHRVHLTKLSEILASVACQSSGLNCDFARFTNKPLVKKIAFVLAPGMDHKSYVDTFGALHCKNMKRIFSNSDKELGGGIHCVATRCMNPTAKGATHARTILYNGGWASTKKKREAKYKNDEAAKAYRLSKEDGDKANIEQKEEKKKNKFTNNERITTETKVLQLLRDAPRKLSVKSATLIAEDMADMGYPLPTLVHKRKKREGEKT